MQGRESGGSSCNNQGMASMKNQYEYSVLTDDAQAAGYARVLAHSFGRPEADSATWIARFDRKDVRLLCAGGKVQAGLILIHMGQFFGGRSVPMTGISAVGAAPEARGHGAATELMRRTILELHESGVAISTLYPATQRLYRLAGYEQAGHRFEVRLPLQSLGARERSLGVRPMEEGDTGSVRAMYRRAAHDRNGNLDRAPIGWDRIERPPPTRVEPARAFVIEGEEGVEGYVYLTQVAPAGPTWGKHEVHVHDMGAATPGAARRVWSFLAGYATMASDVLCYMGPAHSLLMVLSEQPYRMTHQSHWMTRIVDVEKAITARGYARGLHARFALEVSDPIVGANNGVFVVDVGDGSARVTRGGAGGAPVLRATINGLASLYTGFMPAASLRMIGMVEGDDEAVRVAGEVFAGGAAWMSDMF